MSYREKPQLKLYKYVNSAFILQAIIDDFQECSFEHNLYEAGIFTITINYNIPNALLFQRGLFIQFGNNPYDFGEIYSIQDSIGEDGKGSQIRTITGYDARYLLKRRVIKNMNSNGLWVMTAKGELCLRNLIKDQCGSGAEAKRQLPINNVIPASSDAIGKEYSVSEQFTNLYEVCKTIATQSEIGWRIAFNGSLTLEVYAGNDLSQTVRFDTNYESLADGQFTDSSESFSNAIYVGGKGQNDDRDIYEGENGTPSGLDRFESWDNQSSMTTESEYEAEALSMLTQYGQTIQMSGNGLAKCPYIYKEQYDVGDLITVAFSGKSAVVQILSVTEHWAWGSYDIQFSFGKPQNNLAEQLQLMLRQIQKASEKATSTDSVRWYTIPTDSAMPKADVTYNTIGFTGSVGSGMTFTLYLDNEKTGAKTYHVYFKQLGGTGKLTLTTGKQGAVNLTMGVGTYVAIISVDENGNIVNVASTPTDIISSGNNQPATSGGVADAIQDVVDVSSSLPTDAVLHYSFDEVPDYPDGTADVRLLDNNTYDIQSTNYLFRLWRGTTLTNSNGNVLLTSSASSDGQSGVCIYGSYITNKIVKIKLKINSMTSSIDIANGKGTGGEVVERFTKIGVYEFSLVINSNAQYPNLYITTTNTNESAEIEILAIYIGDGSYSTPIIDNVNGQNNATNNGGIATKGVSGKGAYFLKGMYATVNNFNFTDNFSISVWVKPDNMKNGKKREIVSKSRCFLLRNGDGGSNNYLFGAVYNKSTSSYAYFIVQSTLLDNTKYTHICITKNGTTVKAFVDGGYRRITNLNFTEMNINNNNLIINATNNFSPQSYDDLLIFDRALSDTEVQALYQNKANTPKYYNINNYNLKQIKDITAQSTDFADFQSRMAGLATRSLQLIEPTEDER